RHPIDLSRPRAALAAMGAAGVDVRIVSLHWGYEFEYYPDPDVMQVGHEIVRAGADLGLGTHPHVVQPLEVCAVNGYEAGEGAGRLEAEGPPRKALVAYSLGNFATAMFTPHCQVGLALGLSLARDARTGRVDWHRPELTLLHTAQRHPETGGRRLVLLE